MKTDDIDKLLTDLNAHQKVNVLITYGHQLTVIARGAYEVQGEGVEFPEWLRAINEIMHRIFPAISELHNNSNSQFSIDSIAHWISCEARNQKLQKSSVEAFKFALERCKD